MSVGDNILEFCGKYAPLTYFQSEHSLNTRRYEEQYGHINDFQEYIL